MYIFMSTIRQMTQIERLEALLRMSRGRGAEVFVADLHHIVDFDYLFISDCSENTDEAKSLLEINGIRRRPSEAGIPLRDNTGFWVYEQQQALTIGDWAQETRFPEMKGFLREMGIASTCTLPLGREDRKLGVIEFGSSQPNAYREAEVAFLKVVADQVALLFDATINFLSTEVAESRLKLLLELTNSVVSSLDFREVMRAISASVRRVMQCHGVSVLLPDATGKNLAGFVTDAERDLVPSHKLFPIEGSLLGKAFQTGSPVSGNSAELLSRFFENAEQRAVIVSEIKSICVAPLISRKRALGVLALGKCQENGFGRGDVVFLMQVANQVAIAVENALAYREIAELRDKLA